MKEGDRPAIWLSTLFVLLCWAGAILAVDRFLLSAHIRDAGLSLAVSLAIVQCVCVVLMLAGLMARADDASAGQVVLRRYVGDEGHYFGFRAGVGRDEIRSGSDLDSLDRTEVVAEALVPISRGFVVNLRAGGGEGKGTAMIAIGYRR